MAKTTDAEGTALAGKAARSGRPSKFRPEIGQRIVDLVRVTGMLEAAAEACGVHRATVYRWIEDGMAGKSTALRNFSESILKARGESETRLLTLITKSANAGDWRAATWLLERRNPRLYGPRIQLTLRQSLEEMTDELATNAPHLLEDFLRIFAGDPGDPTSTMPDGVVIMETENWSETQRVASQKSGRVEEGEPR